MFPTDRKYGQIVNSPKDKIPLEAQGVYVCRNCKVSYIIQTNRKISARREEHKLAVRAKQKTWALAQHVLMTRHKIDFEKAITISTSEHLPTSRSHRDREASE
ncbi:hypothetical protein Trydic_g11034 [Trypoxylus dichotomus]